MRLSGAASKPPAGDLVLVGGGHAHVFVLKAFAERPEPGLSLTLIVKEGLTPYSGMLPGHMAGFYTRGEMHIDLARLARASGATLIEDEAIRFDTAARLVVLKSGKAVPYGVLSIDIGITPDLSGIPGAGDHALAVKPIGDLLPKWDRVVRAVLRPDGPRGIVIVGGGVAGLCLAFAISAFLRPKIRDSLRVSLIGASASPEFNAGMRRRIARALRRHDIAVFYDPAVSVDPEGVTL